MNKKMSRIKFYETDLSKDQVPYNTKAYSTDMDISNKLSGRDKIKVEYIDNIVGANNKFDESNINNTGFLVEQKEMAEYVKTFNKFNYDRRKNLDWSEYRTPAKQTGQGFGNPNDYSDIHIGLDSRLRKNPDEIYNNPRNVDLQTHHMIPPEQMMINYAGVQYQSDIRAGSQTRAQRKVNSGNIRN